MLKLKIIVVDRTRAGFLAEAQSFYLNRLKRYAHVTWIETKPAKIPKGRNIHPVLNEEAEGIFKKLQNKDHVIALDRGGIVFDSEKLAIRLEKLTFSQSEITFIIGGPLGLSQEVLDRADTILSLSKLTFTHEMSRVLLLEQLYRAFTIIHNEKYHK